MMHSPQVTSSNPPNYTFAGGTRKQAQGPRDSPRPHVKCMWVGKGGRLLPSPGQASNMRATNHRWLGALEM